MLDPQSFLEDLFHVAVDAAHPCLRLEAYLPQDRSGRALVIGAGKAAAAMAEAFEQAWQGELSGLVVTRYGHGTRCRKIAVVEASHPIPDDAGLGAAQEMLRLVSSLGKADQVFFLLSGGGSSLLTLPAPGISLDQKKAVTKALLNSGAAIDEINCVRKHLSAIKGGRLALACRPAQLYTLAISDVPGDDPCVIASGPSVADPTSRTQALAVLQRYRIGAPPAVLNWLHNPASETPKEADLPTAITPYKIISTPLQALEAAAAKARASGVEPLILGDNIEGEAREVAKVMAGIARYMQDAPSIPKPLVILSGGETTVTVKGSGRGGRNAEFLLALAIALNGRQGVTALAADTDGIDGSEDNAGALLSADALTRATNLGLDPRQMLDNNDGYGFFAALDSLVVTGPTCTNVNDFRAILIQ